METNNLILTYPAATIEAAIHEELKTRLNLNDTNEAEYWINQVTGKNTVIDFLVNQISPLIDSPINIRLPKGE